MKPAHELVHRSMKPDERDLAMFREIFAQNGYPKPIEEYRWQYLDTAAGEIFVNFVVDERPPREKLAAVIACFPVRFKLAEKLVLAMQCHNAMTDADYRGQGLFFKATYDLFDRCSADGVPFVYGFPNGNSAPSFFSKLGWDRLDPVPYLIKPLRANYFLGRIHQLQRLSDALPTIPLSRSLRPHLDVGYTVDRRLCFDESFDYVWEAFSEEIPVAVHRDHRYLTWRFANKPGVDYRMIAIRQGKDVCAYVIYCANDKHGGRIGYIMEYLAHPLHEEAGAALLAMAVDELREQQCDALLAWNFAHSPNHAAYRSVGFLPFPERIRPLEVHMGVGPFERRWTATLRERTNWYVSYADSDTV